MFMNKFVNKFFCLLALVHNDGLFNFDCAVCLLHWQQCPFRVSVLCDISFNF